MIQSVPFSQFNCNPSQFIRSGGIDCLTKIFKNLQPSDIFSCLCTSKVWHIAASESLWGFLISKAFPPASNCFLANSSKFSQKDLFKYSYNLANGWCLNETLPGNEEFRYLQQNGKGFIVSKSGCIYTWNGKGQTFDRIKNLCELPHPRRPQETYSFSSGVDKILKCTQDTFAVLYRRPTCLTRASFGYVNIETEKKESLIKIFDSKFVPIREISLDVPIRKLKVTESAQFIGITGFGDLLCISGNSISTSKFENKWKRIEYIASLYHEKCLCVGSEFQSIRQRKTFLFLFDIAQGVKLLKEIDLPFFPIRPFNSELYANRFLLLPNEGSCRIFDLEQEIDAPMVEIPFGNASMRLVWFNAQGELLFSDCEYTPTVVVLDPENEWKQVHGEIKYQVKSLGCYAPFDHLVSYDDVTFLHRNRRPYGGPITKIAPGDSELDTIVGDGLVFRIEKLTLAKKLINCDPSSKKFVLQLADNLKTKDSIDGFEKLPKRVRKVVYGQLHSILIENGELTPDSSYPGDGEDAFHGRAERATIDGKGKNAAQATPDDKIDALERAAELI